MKRRGSDLLPEGIFIFDGLAKGTASLVESGYYKDADLAWGVSRLEWAMNVAELGW
jgi:hypothetical protein